MFAFTRRALLGWCAAGALGGIAGLRAAEPVPPTLARSTLPPVTTPAPVLAAPAPCAAPSCPAPACTPEAGPRSEMVWFRADLLLWWTKGAPLPSPLVTTGPVPPGAGADFRPGALGQNGTRVLLGGDEVDFGPQTGARFTLGSWLGQAPVGVEGSFFFLGREPAERTFFSSGAPGSAALSLPFRDAATGVESTTGLALPGAFSGTVRLALTTYLQGFELNGLYRAFEAENVRVALIAGYRNLLLRDKLRFETSSPAFGDPTDVFLTLDRIYTTSDFNGAQVGARLDYEGGRFVARLGTKVALGNSEQTFHQTGFTRTNSFDDVLRVFPGGYLVTPSNGGRFERDRFAVVTDTNLTTGVQLTKCLRAMVGYSFLYFSSVARPGEQIDRTVNPLQSAAYFVGGPANTPPLRPSFVGRGTDYWAHGLNFTMELRY